MKRKVLGILLFLVIAFLFAGCDMISSTTSTQATTVGQAADTTSMQSLGSVTIELGMTGDDPDTQAVETEYIAQTKTVEFYEGDTLFDLLNNNFDTTYDTYSFGHMMTKIGVLLPEGNQYISFYVNGTLSMTGVDGVSLKDGDVYLFEIAS